MIESKENKAQMVGLQDICIATYKVTIIFQQHSVTCFPYLQGLVWNYRNQATYLFEPFWGSSRDV